MGIKDLFGKKSKKTEPFANGKKRDLNDQLLQARMELDKASRKNLEVIEMQKRNILYCRRNNMGKASEERYIAKMKNAYYSLSVINATRMRMNDIENSQELYQAMNDITSAMKRINTVYRKGPKPKAGKFNRQKEKMEANAEQENEILGEMYDGDQGINDLVSNDLVERIIKGEDAQECLRSNEGIEVPYSDLMDYDLDDISASFENIMNEVSGDDGNATTFDSDDVDLDVSDYKL